MYNWYVPYGITYFKLNYIFLHTCIYLVSSPDSDDPTSQRNRLPPSRTRRSAENNLEVIESGNLFRKGKTASMVISDTNSIHDNATDNTNDFSSKKKSTQDQYNSIDTSTIHDNLTDNRDAFIKKPSSSEKSQTTSIGKAPVTLSGFAH